jgi:nitrite reductase (NADH) small subunit
LKNITEAQDTDEWETVCYLEDLVPDSGVSVLFNYHQVALFYIGTPQHVYAISNFDPFSKANVLSKGKVGYLKGHPVVTSPIFGQHFCLDTGECMEADDITLDVYQSRMVGNQVQLRHNPS